MIPTEMARPAAGLVSALFAALLFALALVNPAAAVAQTAAESPPPSVQELERLVETLSDDAKREELVTQLRTLIAARRTAAAAEAEPGLGSRLLNGLSGQVEALRSQTVAAVEFLVDLPRVWAWLGGQFGYQEQRDRWIELLMKVGIVLAVAFLVERLFRALLAAPRRSIESRTTERLPVRLVLLVARTVLDALPILAFAIAAYGVLPLLEPSRPTRLAALAIINANVVVRLVTAAARMLLAPEVSSLRIAGVADQTAQYLYLWVRRLAAVTVYGYFLIEALRALGMPYDAYAVLLKLLGLILAALLVIVILQNRASAAQVLRGPGDGREGGLRMLRARFADVWHVFAIAYVLGAFFIWALQVDGGFEYLFRATLLTIVVLLVARIAAAIVRQALSRGFAIGGELREKYPTLESHANRYLPILRYALLTVVWFVAALALLEAWGVRGFEWVTSDVGAALVGTVLKIAFLVLVAVVVLELVNGATERYLRGAGSSGSMITRSQRVRTLLPLLQKLAFVAVTVIVGLVVLSEIGLDIGPLLAGAGIIGLAVGFGAQTLVKDIITGIFILTEDQFSVGDVINAGGKGGLVEAISIRTIRLRDLSGTVHVIPFSEVGSTANLTKEFSYYVFDVGVAYREDTDEVVEVLKEIAQGMIDDPEFGPKILPPFEVLGVDAFADSAVVIKCRIKTLPIQQWTIGREFNRRMKKRFDELGIEIPFPHRTVYFGIDKQGKAPPARVEIDGRARTIAAAEAVGGEPGPPLVGGSEGENAAGR